MLARGAAAAPAETRANEGLARGAMAGESSSGERPPGAERPADPREEDNLRLIRGVDLTLAHELHEIGVWRFAQIAAWSPQNIAWIAERFRQLGPVAAWGWPRQAQLLAAGVPTDYARELSAGEAPANHFDDAALKGWLETLPQPQRPAPGDSLYPGTRPAALLEPPYGERDYLTRIGGIDADLQARLNGLGVWTLRQIAHWTPDNARWIGAYLAAPGRPEQQDWIGQARAALD